MNEKTAGHEIPKTYECGCGVVTHATAWHLVRPTCPDHGKPIRFMRPNPPVLTPTHKTR